VQTGVDKDWEQEKLDLPAKLAQAEARKMLARSVATNPTCPVHPRRWRAIILYERNGGAMCLYQLGKRRKYTPKRQARKLPFGQSNGEHACERSPAVHHGFRSS